ncbi:uncharacterized protein LOC8078302 [Sorghum bicolor]|uniref:uncharacterized protein LOC8078302 n=1 Tax=Sorghum bicolor TaxID=4558 RepID=UPI000B424649|nr:uncharacterized protein LOC8078302 [Sorghum bicolor]|eukprot:XP_021304277.1 uncharacterized protein LOC8078302 [Sorghum bicolor]
MTKAMGRRLPIAIAQGKRRLDEPVQATKFASESGVIIRNKGRLAINDKDKPTEETCTDVLCSGVRQMRYRLKKKYFNDVLANEIPTTSLVSSMSDQEWQALVAKWTNPKNMETSEKNKNNHSRVKYHETTGSRSYVAHLHTYKQNRNNAEPNIDNEELDVVEAFKTCHTSSKHGLSEPAREAVISPNISFAMLFCASIG